MTNCIWYNPEESEYKFGTLVDFDAEIKSSMNSSKFKILRVFESKNTSKATQVMKLLNHLSNNSPNFHIY